MRKLVRRALKSIDRLNQERLHALVHELVADNEQLEIVLSSIPGGVVVIGSDGAVQMFNTPAKRLLPLTVPDPMDMNICEVIASKDISEYVKMALEGDTGAPMKDFLVNKGGRNCILSCGVLTLVYQGRIKGNMFYIEDVTNLRAEEMRLKRAEALASLSTMAAGVAHEIKNPLASMSIQLQLMRRKIRDNILDRQDSLHTLDILEEETQRLNNIVSDYLFTVRPMQTSPEPVDVNNILINLMDFLMQEMKQNKIRLIQHLAENLPSVCLDEAGLKQAVLNLVKNAQAAMPDGGDLRIETDFDANAIQLIVSDTGCGIPEDIQVKIFDPYFTTRDTGSGLGLTMVYKFVREHGGDLQMDSSPGHGTIFRISIPYYRYEQKLLDGGTLQ